MKNVIGEKPVRKLYGGLLARATFVLSKDIKNKKVLDIGCGYGWFEIYLVKRGVKKAVGLDNQKETVEIAKRYSNNKNVKFIVGDASKLPFRDSSFDTIVCWETLEHIKKESELSFFQQVKRVLRKGGYFYLTTPYDNFISKITDPAWVLFDHRHYSFAKLKDLGNKSGFSLEDIFRSGGYISTMYILNWYITKWIFRRTPFFAKFFENLSTWEYKKRSGFVNVFVKYKNE